MRHTIKTIITAAVFGLCASGGAALANGDGKCFDKATLSYVDCPGGVDWSGWYLGAHAGYAMADFEGDFGTLSYDDLDVDGPMAGAQIAYLEQIDSNIVVGLEVDLSAVWADDTAGGSATFNFGAGAVVVPFGIEAELDWLASARMKVGYAAGEWMPYITGGVALAGWEADAFAGANSASAEETSFGGVAGGGLEVMFNENWVGGVEGLYYFFGDDTDLNVGGNITNVELDDVGVVRARLSYKF